MRHCATRNEDVETARLGKAWERFMIFSLLLFVPSRRIGGRAFVGASMLAMSLRAPRGVRLPALSLTTIVGTPPGACSLLQGGGHVSGGVCTDEVLASCALQCELDHLPG